MRQIACHGQERRYHHVRVGINSRLDTLQAAILLPKLSVLDDEISMRQQVADRYCALLREQGCKTTPFVESHNISAWAQFTIRVKDRAHVQGVLSQEGIPTAVHYPTPLNKQPAFADLSCALPVGDLVAQQVISLPMGPYLRPDEQQKVVEAVGKALNGTR